MTDIFLKRFKPCRFNSYALLPLLNVTSSQRAGIRILSSSLCLAHVFDTGAQKHRMTPGWPSSVPESPKSPIVWDWSPSQGNSEIMLCFGDRLTHGWWLFKGCYHSLKSGHAGALWPVTGSWRWACQEQFPRTKSTQTHSLFALLSLCLERVCR